MCAKNVSKLAGVLLFGISVPLLSSEALAGPGTGITFGAEYVQYWDSGCRVGGDLADLYYTKNLIHYFADEMVSQGATKNFLYGNHSAWSTDLIAPSRESGVCNSGQSDRYADTVDLFAYAGHAGSSSSEDYFLKACLPTTCYNQRTNTNETCSSSCKFYDSTETTWGNTHLGMRWAIMSTCHSIESSPAVQWKRGLGSHFEYLMGYRGLEYLGTTTDEVLEDWAQYAIGKTWTFRGAWFYAIEDWYLDNEGAVLSVGDEGSEARYRRDNQTTYFAKRNGLGLPSYFAWSFYRDGESKYDYYASSGTFYGYRR